MNFFSLCFEYFILVGDSEITVRIDCQSFAYIFRIYFGNDFVSFEQSSCKSYPLDGGVHVLAKEHAVFVVKIAVNTIGFISSRVFEIRKFILFIHSIRQTNTDTLKMVRKLKFHEEKLLKKVDFMNWSVDNNLHESKVMRKFQIRKREDYTK